jgi:hypothetical protein
MAVSGVWDDDGEAMTAVETACPDCGCKLGEGMRCNECGWKPTSYPGPGENGDRGGLPDVALKTPSWNKRKRQGKGTRVYRCRVQEKCVAGPMTSYDALLSHEMAVHGRLGGTRGRPKKAGKAGRPSEAVAPSRLERDRVNDRRAPEEVRVVLGRALDLLIEKRDDLNRIITPFSALLGRT